jgi:hypothetical protein
VQTNEVDTEHNLVIATLGHFTDFALMQESSTEEYNPSSNENLLYLPIIHIDD